MARPVRCNGLFGQAPFLETAILLISTRYHLTRWLGSTSHRNYYLPRNRSATSRVIGLEYTAVGSLGWRPVR